MRTSETEPDLRVLLSGRPADAPVWLRVGRLFDGERALGGGAAHVVFDARAIRHVGGESRPPPLEAIRPGQEEPDADLPGFTLLPGLIEAHSHLFLQGSEIDLARRKSHQSLPPGALLREAQKRLLPILETGVMAMRDAGDKDGVGLCLAALYRGSGRPRMPLVDSPGAAIHHRGGYGSFMGRPLEEHETPEACVEARVREGADRIKLIASGIIDFRQAAVITPPRMTAEEVARIVRAARSHGKQTLAHASGEAGIENAIAGGVDTIEHGYFITRDQLMRMRDLGIAWVPTFAPVQRQVDHAAALGWDRQVVDNLHRILEAHARSVEEAHRLQVPLLAGSDSGSCGVAHGLGLLYELELLERAGLPAEAVLRAATGGPAARLAFPERIGRIEPGARARMVLTRHDPLEGICNLLKEKWCLFDGVVLRSECDRLDDGTL